MRAGTIRPVTAIRRRIAGDQDVPDDDGMIWADLWVNIAFVLFVLVSDPSTAWLLDDVRPLADGGASETAGPPRVLHLVADADGAPVLRDGAVDGPALDEATMQSAIGRWTAEEPALRIVLAATDTLPAGALMDALARLERAGAPTISIARSAGLGD